MAKTVWSAETKQLQAEAEAAIDKMMRSMNKDRFDCGAQDVADYEDYPECIGMEDIQLTAWIVAAQYQSFENPEVACIIHGGSNSVATVKAGLAKYADAYWC